MEIAGIASVQLRVDLPQLQRDLDQSKLMVGRFEQEARRGFTGVHAAAGGMGNAVAGAAARATSATDTLNKSVGNVRAGFNDLIGLVRRYGAMIGISLGIGEFVRLTNTFTDLRGRIENMIGTSADVVDIMDQLYDVARRTYSSFQSTAEVFLQNRMTLEGLGYTIQETMTFTESMNNALVVSGAKADVAATVMRQLGQAMSLGKLSGENLNSVLSAGGRIVKLLADELGVTTTEVKRMGQEGKITSDLIFRAAINFSEALREEADNLDVTIGDSFQLMQNAMLMFVGGLNDATGVAQIVANLIVTIADNLDVLAGALLAVGTFMGGRWLIAGIVGMWNYVRSVQIAVAATNAMAIASGGLAAGLTQVSVAGTLARSALTWLTGPFGIALAAITGALLVMGRRTATATAAMGDMASALDAVKEGFSDTAIAAGDFDAVLQQSRIDTFEANIATARVTLRNLKDDLLGFVTEQITHEVPLSMMGTVQSSFDAMLASLGTTINTSEFLSALETLRTIGPEVSVVVDNIRAAINGVSDWRGFSEQEGSIADLVTDIANFTAELGNANETMEEMTGPGAFVQLAAAIREVAAAEAALVGPDMDSLWRTGIDASIAISAARAIVEAAAAKVVFATTAEAAAAALVEEEVAIRNLIAAQQALAMANEAVRDGLAVEAAVAVDAEAATQRLTIAQAALIVATARVDAELEKGDKALRGLVPSLVAATELTGKLSTLTEAHATAVLKWNEALEAGAKTPEEAAAGITFLNEALAKGIGELTGITGVINDFQRELDGIKTEQAVRSMTDLEVAFDELTRRFDGYRDAISTALLNENIQDAEKETLIALLATVDALQAAEIGWARTADATAQAAARTQEFSSALERVGARAGVITFLENLQTSLSAVAGNGWMVASALRMVSTWLDILSGKSGAVTAITEGIASIERDTAILGMTGQDAAVARALDSYKDNLAGITDETERLGFESQITAAAIENYNKQQEISAQGAGASAASAAADAFESATKSIEEQIKTLEFEATLIGKTADEVARLRMEQELLAAQEQLMEAAGPIVSEAELAAISDLVERLGLAKGALAALQQEAAEPKAWEIAKGFAESFVQSLVSGLISGKTAAEALTTAIGGLASSLASSAIKDLFSGNFLAAGIKGIFALIFAVIARRRAEREEMEKAQQSWADMADELANFAARLRGGGQGDLYSSLKAASDETQKFADAAAKAGVSIAEINAMLAEFAARRLNQFVGDFGILLDALSEGLGANSPAVGAASNVLSVGQALRDFVDDTRLAVSILGETNAPVDAAIAAARSYALSLLATEPVLSAVEIRLRELQGTSAHLQSLLEDLGMSAEEAGLAVQQGLLEAFARLRTDFQADLSSRLNEAMGRGYLNEITDLIQEGASLLNDALLLGVDTTTLGQYFAVAAQNIVDGAGLTGTAFDELIALFPDLAGVVHEAADSVTESMEQINSAGKSILEWVNQQLAGPSSTASPTDRLSAAQTSYNAQLVLAQTGNIDAQAGITGFANDLLAAARDVYASGPAYQAIRESILAALTTLPAAVTADDPVVVALREAVVSILGSDAATRSALIAALAIIPGEFRNKIGPYFTMLDANGDLLLTATELAGLGTVAEIGALITAADTNADGMISATELARSALIAALAAVPGDLRNKLAPYFFMLDANGDLILTATELAGLGTVEEIAALITAVDLNGDGMVGHLELIRASIWGIGGDVRNKLAPYFNMLDTNGDLLLSASELVGIGTEQQIADLITAIDANGDGMISKQELTTAAVDQVDSNTDAALTLLSAVQGLATVQQTTTNTISQSILSLGAVTQDINLWLADNYFGPMHDALERIASYTELMAAADDEENEGFFARWRARREERRAAREATGGFLQFATGGWVPGSGNQDSVRAMLTPGELVLNPMQASAYVSNNDNRADMKILQQLMAGSANAQVRALHEEMAGLKATIRDIGDVVRRGQTSARPGTKRAA